MVLASRHLRVAAAGLVFGAGLFTILGAESLRSPGIVLLIVAVAVLGAWAACRRRTC